MVATALAATTAYMGYKAADEAEKGRKEQKKAIEKDQEIQKTEIAEQKAVALEKRKGAIDLQRRQLYGKSKQPASAVDQTTQTQGIGGETLG